MKVFIEHYPNQTELAERITKRINSIKGLTVKTFSDLMKEHNDKLDDQAVVDEIQNYDIIIPIIADDYSNELINNQFEEFADSKDKFLLPIIFDDTKWSSINWIVKSKVLPEDGSPFNSLDEKSKASAINKLVQTIEEIVSRKNSTVDAPKRHENFVFISHSHADSDFAELVKLHLEKNGIVGWMDSERLKVGQDWRQEIDDGISNSIALIVIMTPDAKTSEYVTYEWAFAWGKGIPIVPLMLKQTTLHPRLESLQYLDFTNRITRPWQKLFDSLKLKQK